MSTQQSMTLQDRNRDSELAFLFRETRNPDYYAEICERNRLRLDALPFGLAVKLI